MNADYYDNLLNSDSVANVHLMAESIVALYLKEAHAKKYIGKYFNDCIFSGEANSDTDVAKLIKEINAFQKEHGVAPTIRTMTAYLTYKNRTALTDYMSDLACGNTHIADESLFVKQLEKYIKKNMKDNILSKITSLQMDGTNSDLAKYEEEKSLEDRFLEITNLSLSSFDGTSFTDVDKFNEMNQQQDVVFPSRYKEINAAVGGYIKGTLSLWLAGTGGGKTTLMYNEAAHLFEAGYDVLYCSLEMKTISIWRRMYSNVFNMPINHTTSPDLVAQKAGEAFDKKANKLVIYELATDRLTDKSNGFTANELRIYLDTLRRTSGFVPQVVFLDYIGLMKPTNPKTNTKTHEDLATVGKEIRSVAVDYNVAIITAHQLNRVGNSKSNDAAIDDISGSWDMAADMDLIGIISSSPDQKARGIKHIKSVKTREGSAFEFFAQADWATYRMDSMTPHQASTMNMFEHAHEVGNSAPAYAPSSSSSDAAAKLGLVIPTPITSLIEGEE